MLPLSKVFDPPDLSHTYLEDALSQIDAYDTLAGQYALRRWEYAMAILAFDRWHDEAQPPLRTGPIVDVGGAGSQFWQVISDRTHVVDPKEGCSLENYLQKAPKLASAVFCLSVIEHVENLDQFLYHLSCLVAPGGLLFLTTDCREGGNYHEGMFPKDDRHFHWDRRRIFTPRALRWVGELLSPLRFESFGDLDLTYTQPFENWGYTVASICLRKQA